MVKNDCVFCQIKDGELDAAWVYRSKDVLAFLDRRPVFLGHVLITPHDHHRNIFECPPDEIAGLFDVTQKMSLAVKQAMESDGVFIASNNGVSQSVDHLHIHVVPRRKKDGLRGFMWPRLEYENDEQIHQHAAKIAAAYEQVARSCQ